MRLRAGVTCATMTCAGAAIVVAGGLASCVSNGNNPGPAGGDASPFDATQPDTSVPVTTPDAGVNATPGTDAAPAPDDSGPGVDAADASPGCVPTGAAFTPPPYVPAQPQTFVCTTNAGGTDTDDLDFAQACAGDASTYQACRTFATTGEDGGVAPACGACLLTPETVDDAGTYGAAVVGPVVALNVAGCVEIADPSDAGYSCAVAIQAAAKCVEAQCTANCPVTDDLSQAAFLACTKAAAVNSVCSPLTLSANGCLAAEADAGAQVDQWCIGAPDPVTQFEDIARFFCTS